MRRRRSAVSPSNVDPLRSTTLRGVRSARRSRGNSSALNRKSCHAPVSVMLEKRGGCCRTDGPRRVRSGQMLHTIAAINAACCCSLRSTSSPRASCSASCPQFIANCNKRCLTGAERTIPTVHLHISHVTPARHAQGALSILRALVACALVAQIAVFVLFGVL